MALVVHHGLCFSSSPSSFRQPLRPPITKMVGSTKYFFNNPNFAPNVGGLKSCFSVQASNSQGEEQGTTIKTRNGFSREDWNYLWKLGVGSAAGAAVIKYGSIIFPEITTPNLLQALIMISTPVVVAIVLLIKQSRSE